MPSIFTKIVNREIPAYIVAEDDNYLAFLDIFPLVKGHVLVIPKLEIDNIFDLEDDVLQGLHLFAKKVAKAQAKVIPCIRIGMAVIGLEVPHAHIHLVPLNSMGDIDFKKVKLNLSSEELQAIANKISQAYLEINL